MDLRQLDMFRTVAETSSFTRAGEKLHVSHSAVSRQVKLLEDELCVPLFTRANKRVLLTEPGKVLFHHVGAIFDKVSQAAQSISEISKGVTYYLRLGTGTTMLNFFLPPVFEQFKNHYPAVSINIKTGQLPVILEDVRNGALEVVLGTLPTPLEARDFLVRPLYREELVVVVSKHHRLAKRKTLEPKELNDLPLITFPSYSATRQVLDEMFRDVRVSPQIELELENDEAVVRSVTKDMRVAFLPKRRAIQERLHFLRIADTPVFRTVGLVSLRSRQPSEYLNYFSNLCIERAEIAFASDLPSGLSRRGSNPNRKPSLLAEVDRHSCNVVRPTG